MSEDPTEEQQQEQHGHTAANAIKAHVARALEVKMDEVMAVLAKTREVTITFAHKIDLGDVKPNVKSKMTFTETYSWKGVSTMDDPNQGSFEFVGGDDGFGMPEQEGAAITIQSGDQSVTLSGRKRRTKKPKVEDAAKEPEAQPGQDAPHYEDIK